MGDLKDVLIIEIDATLPDHVKERIQASVRRQIKDGVVILPSYAHAKIVQCPEDIDIQIKDYERIDVPTV